MQDKKEQVDIAPDPDLEDEEEEVDPEVKDKKGEVNILADSDLDDEEVQDKGVPIEAVPVPEVQDEEKKIEILVNPELQDDKREVDILLVDLERKDEEKQRQVERTVDLEVQNKEKGVLPPHPSMISQSKARIISISSGIAVGVLLPATAIGITLLIIPDPTSAIKDIFLCGPEAFLSNLQASSALHIVMVSALCAGVIVGATTSIMLSHKLSERVSQGNSVAY